MKNLWLKVVVAVVILAVLALPACKAATPSITKELKIGFSVPFSGYGAPWGIPPFRSMELLVDKIDEEGGIDIQGEKYTIKLSAYDNKYDATEGAIIAQRLIDEGVLVIVTALGPPSMAARDLCRENGVIRWGTAYAKEEPSPEYPLAFAYAIRYTESYPAGYDWLAKEYPEIKTTAHIDSNMPWSPWGAEVFRTCATKNGLTVVGEELYKPGTIDFSAILLKVLDAKPDIIDLTGSDIRDCGTMIKQARMLGYTGMFVNNWAGGHLPIIVDIAGIENAEGTIAGLAPVEPYPSAIQEVADRYQAKYGEDIQPYVITMYAGHETLLQAIEQAQTLDTAVIAETLRTGEFDTIIGKAWFGNKDYFGIANQILTPNPLAMVKDGKIQQLTWLEPVSY